jgi:LysM repeat protein
VGSRGSELIFVTVFSAGTGSASIASVEEIPADEPPSMRIQQETVPPGGLDYTIQAGDTLLAIGLRYGLPWERLADENALTERSLLQIGQVIHVPGEGPAQAAAPDMQDVETELYQVQPGDTLFGIAGQRGLSWQEVAAVNGFGEQTVLQIAQVIFVPKVTVPDGLPAEVIAPSGGTAPMDKGVSASVAANEARMVMAVEAQPVATVAAVSAADEATEIAGTGGAVADADWYAVAPGDTVISIALRYQLEWQALLALNGLADDTLLQVGQRVRLR